MRKFRYLRLGFFRLDLFFTVTVICAVAFGYFNMLLISFISVLIHECAHIIASGFLGVGISRVDIHPFGVCAILKNGYINSSEKEFFIAFCGPLTSLILAFLSLCAKPPLWDFIFSVNMCICIVNLLPILPLDGGRMIKSILTEKMGILRAYNASIKGSKALIFLLIPLSAWVLFVTKFNFSYVLITAFLLGNIYSEQKNITLVTLREILENPRKINSLKRTRVFTVSGSEGARSILRRISYDYYITVNITKNGKILAVLSETQIIEGLLSYGILSTFEDIARKSCADFNCQSRGDCNFNQVTYSK